MKWFQVLLFNTDYSIQHYSFVCTHLNSSSLSLSRDAVGVFDNSSQLGTQLDGSKYCYISLTIQLNISHLFIHSWMIKQFYFMQFNSACHLFAQFRYQSVLFDQSGPGSNGNEGVLHIPLISKAGVSPSDGLMSYLRHSLGTRVLPLCRDAVGDSTASADWALKSEGTVDHNHLHDPGSKSPRSCRIVPYVLSKYCTTFDSLL